jgi:hypothetical protein
VASRCVNGGKAFDGVGDIGVHVGEKERNAVAGLAELTLGSRIDRRRYPKRNLGKLILGRKVFAHSARSNRQRRVALAPAQK